MASPFQARSLPALGALVLLSATLAACRSDRVDTTGSIYPYDVRTRHPFVLADETRTLDVFPTGIGHLDPRQAADVEAFVLEFRRFGRGTMVVDLPQGGPAAQPTGAAIRRLAAENGLPAGALSVGTYAPADPALASPVRLSFRRMEARVASQCGLWPQDAGFKDPIVNARNEPSWNLGCANRSNIAAQVADPVDLVRGRGEGRSDTVRRVRDINELRQGKDPSITWRQDGKAQVKSDVSN